MKPLHFYKKGVALPLRKVVVLLIIILVVLLVPLNFKLFDFTNQKWLQFNDKKCELGMPLESCGIINCNEFDCTGGQQDEFVSYINELREKCEAGDQDACGEVEKLGAGNGNQAEFTGNGNDFYEYLIENKDKFSSNIQATIDNMERNHIELVYSESVSKGIDPFISFAVIVQESLGKADAVSSAGAVGLMQLMPKTAEEVGVPSNLRTNPIMNIQGGTSYLKLVQSYVGSTEPRLYLAAYNGGAGNIKGKPESSWPSESQDYYKKVLGYRDEMKKYIQSNSIENADPVEYLKDAQLTITSCIYRNENINDYHGATDFVLTKGGSKATILHSLVNGQVYHTGYEDGYGNNVRIRGNDNIYYIYAHLASISVSQGQTVSIGTPIGIQGGSGGAYAIHGHFGTTSREDDNTPNAGEFTKNKAAGEYNADYVVSLYKQLGVGKITIQGSCYNNNKIATANNLKNLVG